MVFPMINNCLIHPMRNLEVCYKCIENCDSLCVEEEAPEQHERDEQRWGQGERHLQARADARHEVAWGEREMVSPSKLFCSNMEYSY